MIYSIRLIGIALVVLGSFITIRYLHLNVTPQAAATATGPAYAVRFIDRKFMIALFRPELGLSLSRDVRYGDHDPKHNPLEVIEGTVYEDYSDRFLGSRNIIETRLIMARIRQDLIDKSVLAAGGYQMPFAPFTPTILLLGPIPILIGLSVIILFNGRNTMRIARDSLISTLLVALVFAYQITVPSYFTARLKLGKSDPPSSLSQVSDVFYHTQSVPYASADRSP